jgi:DNA-binding NtrC family response regulator
MSATTQTRERAVSSMPLQLPEGARILIICDHDSETDWLKTVFSEAGFLLECAKSMTAGCEAAKSGRFHVVVSTPLLHDGSWRRLIDVASHYDLGFEIIIWARNFDSSEWAEALNDGAFDVIDALYEKRRTIEIAKHALWAIYLKGVGPSSRTTSPHKAA